MPRSDLDHPLRSIINAKRRRRAAEQAWRLSIIEAHQAGWSLREIGLIADISHVRVLQIIREEGFA
jgi:hypothetical protein